ncbi:MAG: energy transducer TonB [Pseudomonadota bacterium]
MGETSRIGGVFAGTDQAGLVVALALHAAVVAALALQIDFGGERVGPVSESMTVSLATEVSLESTAPDPVAESRAATAPTLGEPEPIAETQSETAPTPPETTPPPRPTRPTPRRETRSTSRPTPTRARSTPRSTPNPTRRRSGNREFDSAFSEGNGTSTSTNETRLPASQIGASATESLQREIDRQIKPRWRGMVPQGADAEKLVSLVSFRLNENGSLSGKPTCRTKPSSITPSNRPQAGTHCERAIRAVQLAAPFKLPDRLYNGWKSIRNWEMKKQ